MKHYFFIYGCRNLCSGMFSFFSESQHFSGDQSIICKKPIGPTYNIDFLVTCSNRIKVQSILFSVHY